jgi:RNA polymerase subunit RPABC4/transcription elongation factor Spt4
MIICNNCQQQNDDQARVCRKCGTSLWLSGRAASSQDFTQQAARPRTTAAATLPPPSFNAERPANAAPVQQYPIQFGNTGFRCPYCHSMQMPVIVQKISPGGWIVFAVMLLVCFPLFWIGLLMKEDQRFCRACGMKLG